MTAASPSLGTSPAHHDAAALWDRYFRRGRRGSDLSAVVTHFLPLVDRAARAVQFHTGHRWGYADLYQAAALAMIEAARTYRPEMGPFEPRAVWRMRHAMMEDFGGQHPMKRSRRRGVAQGRIAGLQEFPRDELGRELQPIDRTAGPLERLIAAENPGEDDGAAWLFESWGEFFGYHMGAGQTVVAQRVGLDQGTVSKLYARVREGFTCCAVRIGVRRRQRRRRGRKAVAIAARIHPRRDPRLFFLANVGPAVAGVAERIGDTERQVAALAKLVRDRARRRVPQTTRPRLGIGGRL